nr:flap endonuclease 1 isoform X1 [Ipomoea batatas]GME19546.1 flap endonuclease 1 isoform X1 [Ipomoea batatas]
MNLAMLGKQGWKLFSDPNALVTRHCGNEAEFASHLFRECTFTVDCWNIAKTRGGVELVRYSPMDSWVKDNCMSKKTMTDGSTWSSTFVYILWLIWKACNDFIFNGKSETPNQVVKLDVGWLLRRGTLLLDMEELPTDLRNGLASSLLNRGWVKLNTDGAMKASTGLASVEGLIRDDCGRWLKGFATKIGLTDSFSVELWGLREGLQLCLREDFDNVWVEMDLVAVVSILNGGLSREETFRSLIKDCLDLVKKLISLLLANFSLTMGIKGLMKLLADNTPRAMKEQKFESYFGRKIAIDASMSIYQFLIVVGRSGTEMLTNEAGETTSHLVGMFSRTIRLLEAGIKPVYVFDGKPPDLKKQELAKRYSRREDATAGLAAAEESGNVEDIEKFSKRTVKVTQQHNSDCKKLLTLMGVPVVEVYGVASEDMDSLTFGAPKFLRHLMDPSSKKIPVMEIEVGKVLEDLELTMDQFIDLCILCGCDYCDSIRGIGPQTALKLVRQHGSLESILENINKERYQIPDEWPYQEARRLFKEPLVLTGDDQPEIKWGPPDEEGLIEFLVDQNGFNKDRVTKAIEKIKAAKNKSSQGRLESFFKPVANTSAPAKRKGTKCVLVSPIPVTKFRMFSVQASFMRTQPRAFCSLIPPSLDMSSNYSMPFIRGVCYSI